MAPDAGARRASGGPAGPGARTAVLGAIGLLALGSLWALDLELEDVFPSLDDMGQLARFFAHAASPVWGHEPGTAVAGAPSVLARALDGAVQTLVFAACAVSLSLPLGLVLGWLGSRAWWSADPLQARTSSSRSWARLLAQATSGAARSVATLLRSVHELIWAALFLAALGLSDLAAVVAIAIPYAGTLAKLFAEMLEEAPPQAARALTAAGAHPVQAVAFGLLPAALPDMTAYLLYRFECALRSSAILGFFGWPTLGFYVREAFENIQFGSVWSYLYVLVALIFVVDRWSGAVRRRMVS